MPSASVLLTISSNSHISTSISLAAEESRIIILGGHRARKKLRETVQELSIRAADKAQNWARNEEGMEIIQVLIILGIAIGLAVIFIGFGDKITAAVGQKVEDIINALG